MIVVKNLTKVYKTRRREVKALDNVSFNLPDTGMVFIVGKSGSGKSTLLNMISGLDKFSGGQIVAGGNSLSRMTRKAREKYLSSYIGYIFQDYRLMEDFTVRQNVELAKDISGSDKAVSEYLEAVDLAGYEDRLPKELSGGQKQRVAIARALIKKPKVILADEPTGNLDKATTTEILTLLKKISEDTLVLIVSHNLRDADEYADRIIELSDGRVIRDKSRVKNYKNEFSYTDGVITLPHHKDLNSDEINVLLRGGRKSKEIVQNSGGFVPTRQPLEKRENVKLHNKGMSLKNLVKIFSIFFKRKIMSKVTTIVLAAVILSVFYVVQALTIYDTTNAVLTTLENSDSYGVIVQQAWSTATTSKYIATMTDEKLEELDRAYDGDMHRLYTEYIFTDDIGIEGNITSASNTIGYYASVTVGTLNTTPEYAAKVLGVDELEVLAGDIYDKDYGIVITDYIADSIIARNPKIAIGKESKEEIYQSLIGERYVGNHYAFTTYINAIVNTNYEEEHREIFDILSQLSADSNLEDLETNPLYINFTADLSERYNMGYNFSENFEEALKEYKYNNAVNGNSFGLSEGMQISLFSIVGDNKKSDYYRLTFLVTENYGLADGEVMLSFDLYNSIFSKNYTPEDVGEINKTLEPTEITLAEYESSKTKNIANSEKVTITKLATNTGVVYMNANTYKEFLKFETKTYSVYLDNIESVKEITDVLTELDFGIFSGRIGNVYFIERCINIFEKFFNITMVFILIACVFFLINFGIKSIRSNIYEIGVIKAMGGIKRDISKIFISQSLVMGVGILVVTYFGMQIGAYLADKVFLASLAAVVQSNFYGIRAIDFYPDIAIMDILISLAVVVVSAIISTKAIDRLNLISILKAKE